MNYSNRRHFFCCFCSSVLWWPDRPACSVWANLREPDEAFGLRYQWGGSHSNKHMLRALGIDTRNIVSLHSFILRLHVLSFLWVELLRDIRCVGGKDYRKKKKKDCNALAI